MMSTRLSFACALVLGAGCISGVVVAGEEAPTVLEPSHGVVRDVAHIYYNLATGERVVTLLGDGQTAGADGNSDRLLWSTNGGIPCAPMTTSFFFALDNPDSNDSLSTGTALVAACDIAMNTVVDCVQIHWVTSHTDTDLNSDGVGDGVVGLAGQWGYFEPDNGTAVNYCNKLPLIVFTLTDLPGNLFGQGSYSAYTVDIDLVSSMSEDLSFEIGDSDEDLQGAAYGNPNVANIDSDFDGRPDSDLDGDGLFDFTWRVRFFQPGTVDFDGDGVVDGVPAPTDADTIGLQFGFPVGAVLDSEGHWTGEVDGSVHGAGTGAEDRFSLREGNLDRDYAGAYNFGGFDCDHNPDGSPGYTPAAIFRHALYGPGGGDCCPVDLNCDGQIDFFDLSLFLQQYQSGGDYNGDGVTDFFDVSGFLVDFNTGCP